ncbi:hypothetical protein D9758_015872 [Tetrapyrgos nigripes]|uniref:UBC core domain-containing protein n=1 Tax=Tetrapyrgos nigripes TaxID=182062 RepID=A0A8H5FMK6_9AGAR|nr:hypothetical protein D9758_015872 [Tetrapyrgos nigripes]
MPPNKNPRPESLSYLEPDAIPKNKRRKLSQPEVSSMTSNEISTHFDFSALSSKNATLKGRKRFGADLGLLKDACGTGTGIVGYGFKVAKIRPGDDDGSVELVINALGAEDQPQPEVLAVSVLVSDTSDYPKSHSYFSYSLSSTDTPPAVQKVIDSISENGNGKPLPDLVEKTLKDLSKSLNKSSGSGSCSAEAITVDSDDDGEDDLSDGGDTEPEEYFDEDDYYNSSSRDPHSLNTSLSSSRKFSLFKLQTDFVDTIASNYRPGLIRLGGDDFILSISLPVVDLTEMVEPRALAAWDRKLLKKPQNLVLLISGWTGMYPYPLGSSSSSSAKPPTLKFKVGLSPSYKPSQEHAKEACRNFGLIVMDAEDELALKKEKERAEALALAQWEASFGADGDGTDDIDANNANDSGTGTSTPNPNNAYPTPAEDDFGSDSENPKSKQDKEDKGTFEPISLSFSLESLLNSHFIKLVQIRQRWGLGWAGAEMVLKECESRQVGEGEVMGDKVLKKLVEGADREERKMGSERENGKGGSEGVGVGGRLPHDPLQQVNRTGGEQELNLPLTAFSYLVRRLMLVADYEALKPYVCDSTLCSYQYYSFGLGPSLEYEIIHNSSTVDLLVSLTYSSAAEGVLDEPLPVGIGLRVNPVDPKKIIQPPTTHRGFPVPNGAVATAGWTGAGAVEPKKPRAGPDGLVDFDELSMGERRVAIMVLIDSLPSIDDMKKHLDRKVRSGKCKPTLKEMNAQILPAAWLVLRWIVGSCLADLEEITSGEEHIKHIDDTTWRQYRFTVGAPDAEDKFKTATEEAQSRDANAKVYPSLYAFHGSPLRNWHSIIRNGLWYKTVTHGRAYGNGVYLAKQAEVSMGHYATAAATAWRHSRSRPQSCVTLAEVVNLPNEFVSNNPYFVVQHTSWIVCRYLLVKGAHYSETGELITSSKKKSEPTHAAVPYVQLDPTQAITLGGQALAVPEPSFQLDQLLQALHAQAQTTEDENDETDGEVFNYDYSANANGKGKEKVVIVLDEDEDEDDDAYIDEDGDIEMIDIFPSDSNHSGSKASASSKSKGKANANAKPADDWVHDPEWVRNAVPMLLPAPQAANRGATAALQRELKAMLKEQDSATSLKELGWYMPPEFIGDNLFQWIVEMHSFDEDIVIAKDMKKEKVNSIVFELRFPPDFPLSPPFFRIITPRFLPFIHGGGGHVTGGGSICMDLLTSSGWLPSYSIPAIIMQIKLAISNPDPRPARLASNWTQHYTVGEALQGYKRAAATHGWQLPDGIDSLVR